MNIFSYESKFSQILMFVADLCILNVVFVLCCLPVFTIGAAQAALYSGIRVLQDPEDDTSPVKAFFKAFPVGFGSVTLSWLIFFVLEVLLGFAVVFASGKVQVVSFWISIVGLILLALLHAQLPLFHSRFSCTAMQLLRNTFFLVLAHPLRSILVAVLIWLPVLMLLWNFPMFLFASLAFLLLYYAVAFLLSFLVMKKPFKTLIDNYNETHDQDGNPIAPEEEPEEDA